MFVQRKEKERVRARELRKAGWAVPAIAIELGVSKSSVSVWVRDLPRRVPKRRARRRLRVLLGEIRRCGKCCRWLPVEFFNRDRNAGRQYWCRGCFTAYFRNRGTKHLAQVRRSKQHRLERARDHVLLHLESSNCADCGESHLVVLEYDHVRDSKTSEVGRLVAVGAKLNAIDAEISKCDVVCANCHRRRTAVRAKSWRNRAHHGEALPSKGAKRQRALTAIQARLASGCTDCGEQDIRALEFDHVKAKSFAVMSALWNGRSLRGILREIENCEVRCANCHRLRTAERAGHFRYWALLASDAEPT